MKLRQRQLISAVFPTTPGPIRPLLTACSIAFAALLPADAIAAGNWNLARGPSHLGRGGANIASPRDTSGIYLNPAALAGVPELQLHIDANLVHDYKTFARAPDQPGARSMVYESVQNEKRPLAPSPGFFASLNLASLGFEGVTVAAGLYGPPRVDAVWDPDGAQRYSAIEAYHLQIHKTLSVAYQAPWMQLRVGMTAMLIDQIVDARLKLNAPIIDNPARPEDSDSDVDVALKATQRNIPAAILAISVAPMKSVVVSAAYQTAYDVRADGSADVSLSEAYDDLADVHGDAVSVHLRMPHVVRVASAYTAPDDSYDVELAVVWEGWSRYRRTRIETHDITIDPGSMAEPLEVSDVVIKNDWRDTWSARVGGRYDILPERLTVRGGLFYEMGAVPAARLNAGAIDLDKVGGALGARLELVRGIWFDFAAGYSQWFTQKVDSSEVLLANAIDPSSVKHPIGNGTYENRQLLMLLGLGMRIGL